jgi:hypothetical protein
MQIFLTIYHPINEQQVSPAIPQGRRSFITKAGAMGELRLFCEKLAHIGNTHVQLILRSADWELLNSSVWGDMTISQLCHHFDL